jgi:hypothetical protein
VHRRLAQVVLSFLSSIQGGSNKPISTSRVVEMDTPPRSLGG